MVDMDAARRAAKRFEVELQATAPQIAAALGDPPRCPRCERRVRLTKRGLIGRHDKGAYHRTACRASGLDYAAETALLHERGRQDA